MLLWHWYLDISATRTVSAGMGGAIFQPMQFSELNAWCQLHGITLKPWQLRAMRLLDAAHLKGLMSKADKVTFEDLEDSG